MRDINEVMIDQYKNEIISIVQVCENLNTLTLLYAHIISVMPNKMDSYQNRQNCLLNISNRCSIIEPQRSDTHG